MIVLLTSGFPFGGEPFLESESSYMPKDTLILALDTKKKAIVNKNVDAIRIDAKKKKFRIAFWSLLSFTDVEVRKEIKYLKKTKRLNLKNVTRMIKYWGLSVVAAKCIISSLRDKGADLSSMVLYSYWMSYHAVAASYIKRKYPDVRFVTRCHGYDLYEYRYESDYIPFRNFILDIANIVFPISQDGYEYLDLRYNKTIRNKLRLSYLGTEDYGQNKKEDGGPFRIISCSNIIEIKRIDKIIEALSILDRDYEWTHFGDGPLRKYIERLAMEKLEKNRFCFKGMVEHNQLMKHITSKEYNLFINVSSTEGLPVSIMEALSAGIPIIATNVGGVSEIVDEKVGTLVDAEISNESLAEIIKTHMDFELEKENSLKANCRERWLKKFSAKVNYSEFYSILKNI